MSECVVRMEMPKNCWVCPFGLDGYIWNENDARTHYVRFCSRHSGEEFHVLETDTIDRPWFCDSFICSLPEGHGRLVDKDEAIESIRTEVTELFFNGLKGTPRPNGDLRFIWNRLEDEDFAPTIVPAERSET